MASLDDHFESEHAVEERARKVARDRRAVTEEAARETRRAEWTGLISRLQRELDDAGDIARFVEAMRSAGSPGTYKSSQRNMLRPSVRFWSVIGYSSYGPASVATPDFYPKAPELAVILTTNGGYGGKRA